MGWAFGDYLQTLLIERDWKASKLAKETGISHVYILELLSGGKSEGVKKKTPPKISVDILEKLSRALNVSVVDLFLAYKGQPAPTGEAPKDGLDFERAVPILAMQAGYDLSSLSLDKKAKLIASISSLSRDFIQLLLRHELK